MSGWKIPRNARLMNGTERALVTRVFGNTLPNQYRIILTDGLGDGRAPFTIPTAALSLQTIPGLFAAAIDSLILQIPGASWFTSMRNFTGSGYTTVTSGLRAISQLGGTTTLGYIMNIGSHYPSMTASQSAKELLVHETAHVWQGSNSVSALTYMLNSVTHQCAGMVSGASRNAAYAYTPGQNFSTYNAEQQAHIIEDWYSSGEPTSGPLWNYIQNNVRRGIP